MPVQLGLFDHLDFRFELPRRTYDDRLELIRAAEQAGFRAYHLAEHHGTPLGMAPSPNVFLAAAAAVTRTIRLGAMVYCLPLYHPLRLLEEICMLDQLSGGRLDVGLGRGASPFEAAFYGVTGEESVPRYVEALAVLKAGLSSTTLDFEGRYYRFEGVPLPMRPLQARIPLWSAPVSAESRQHAVLDGMNIMTLGASERVAELCHAYREQWRAHRGDAAGETPLIGAYRIVVVADDAATARRLAAPAFETWFGHLALLWRQHGATTPFLGLKDFDNAVRLGMVLCGDAVEVADLLARQLETCGYNYPVLQFAFGDLAHAAGMRSLELFAERVMPALPR